MTDPHHHDPASRTGPDERTYFLKRANDHRRLAETSVEADARALHLRFQRLYQEQAARLVGQD